MDKLKKFANLFFLYSLASKFDIRYFNSLNDIKEINKYALENLNKIDTGTSRNVFILNSKKAIKIAKENASEPGIAQNKVEADMSNKFKSLDISCYAKVQVHHPDYIWIISDLVRPVKDLDELCRLFKIQTETMFTLFSPQKFKRKTLSTPVPKELLKLKELVDNGILGRDIMKSNSWGVNTEGNPVLLDYGMNQDVYQNYYSPQSSYEFPEEDEET